MKVRPLLAVASAAVLLPGTAAVATAQTGASAPGAGTVDTDSLLEAADLLVSGTVQRPLGGPLDNIQVTATTHAGEIVASSLTYGGTYELHLAAGTYRITFEDVAGVFAPSIKDEVLVAGDLVLPPVVMLLPPATLLSPPVITGPAVVGGTVSLSDGDWDPAGRRLTIGRAWMLDGVAMPGDGASFTLLPDHVGRVISAVITASTARSHDATATAAGVRVAPAPTRTALAKKRRSTKPTVIVTVKAAGLTPVGKVAISRGRKVLRTVKLVDGTATATVTGLKSGTHRLVASYLGSKVAATSTSRTLKLKIRR